MQTQVSGWGNTGNILGCPAILDNGVLVACSDPFDNGFDNWQEWDGDERCPEGAWGVFNARGREAGRGWTGRVAWRGRCLALGCGWEERKAGWRAGCVRRSAPDTESHACPARLAPHLNLTPSHHITSVTDD